MTRANLQPGKKGVEGEGQEGGEGEGGGEKGLCGDTFCDDS